MDASTTATGTVWGVFAHRFALNTETGKVLGDLGPEAGARIVLAEGDRVTIEGERKLSEIKIAAIVTADGVRHVIDRPRRPDQKQADTAPADPEIALTALRTDGFELSAPPKRKPKHWHVLARRSGQDFEVHVGLDGKIRKLKELPA